MNENGTIKREQVSNAETALTFLEQQQKEIAKLQKAAFADVLFIDTPEASASLEAIGKAIEQRDKARNTLHKTSDFRGLSTALRQKYAANPIELQTQIRLLEKKDPDLGKALAQLHTAAENYKAQEAIFKKKLSATKNNLRTYTIPQKIKAYQADLQQLSHFIDAPLEDLKQDYQKAASQILPKLEKSKERMPVGTSLVANVAQLSGFPDRKDCRTAFVSALKKLQKEISMQTKPAENEKELFDFTGNILSSLDRANERYKENCRIYGNNGDKRLENVMYCLDARQDIFGFDKTKAPALNEPKEHLENGYIMRAKLYLHRREVLNKTHDAVKTSEINPILR